MNIKQLLSLKISDSSRNKGLRDIVFILLLAIFSIGLYFNTFYNDYCLDDAMVITENKITQKGFAGIKEHLTNDFLFGFRSIKSEKNASFWRPIPLISFSVEIGVWGKNKPSYSHLVNVIIYSLVVILLYLLLSKFIFKNKWLSFFSALLFTAHPLHSEVVANIKSRDELLCSFFILSSFFLVGMYANNRRKINLFLSLFCFFMALLSKESAITFLVGLPLFLYFFFERKKKDLLKISAFFLGITILYIFIRNAIVPFNLAEEVNDEYVILNHPFLYADGAQAFFTKIYVLIKYIKMLFIPYPLCFDYSYNQIPYVNASEPLVWISFLANGFLLVYAIINFRKKLILSFCILMYFITMFTISNLLFETAVIFAERFLFSPSIFFCIAVAYLLNRGYLFLNKEWRQKGLIISMILFIPVFVICSSIIVNRNLDWKNTDTLNLADILKAPNSARANDGVGNYYIDASHVKNISLNQKDSLLHLAIKYYSKSIELYPGFDNSLVNIGISYNNIGNQEKAEAYWDELAKYAPTHPMVKEFHNFLSKDYLMKGLAATKNNKLDSSEFYLLRAVKYADFDDSAFVKSWFNLGGTYYLERKYDPCLQALEKVLAVEPNNELAQRGYNTCKTLLQSSKNNSTTP